MSRSSEINEIRRGFIIKKRGLMNRRDRDLRELEEDRKAKHKALEDAHKLEVKGVHDWFEEEMAIAKQDEEIAIGKVRR